MRKEFWLNKLFLLFFLFIFSFQLTAYAGGNPERDDSTGYRSLLLSVDYGSNRIFYGQRLTVNQVYLAPALSYEAPSGFFTAASVYRLLQPEQRVDQAGFTLGWDFKLFDKLSVAPNYSRFVFAKESEQLQSSFKNQLELYLEWNSKLITPRLFVDYLFGDSARDFAMTFDLSHSFEFDYLLTPDNDMLSIKPMMSLSMGTLNFYSFSKIDRKKPVSLRNTKVDVDTRFGFTALEFSLPVEYNIGRFIIEPAGHYSIPLNQPSQEMLQTDPVFYFTLSVGFLII